MKSKMIALAVLALGASFSTTTIAATAFQMNDGGLGGVFGARAGFDYSDIVTARDESGAAAAPIVYTANASASGGGSGMRAPLFASVLFERLSNSQSIVNRSPIMSAWFEAIALEVDPDDGNQRPEIPEVPIPASVWLFMSALGMLVGWKRRRAGEAVA